MIHSMPHLGYLLQHRHASDPQVIQALVDRYYAYIYVYKWHQPFRSEMKYNDAELNRYFAGITSIMIKRAQKAPQKDRI